MKSIPSSVIQQIIVLLLLFLMGGLIFSEMLPYFSGVLGAITLYVMLKGWMQKLVAKKWNPSVAAILLMLISFIVILVPVGGIALMLGNKIGNAVSNSEKVATALFDQLEYWEEKIGFEMNSWIDAGAISSWISTNLQDIAGSTFTVFIAIGIMYFLLYYLLTTSSKNENILKDILPFSDENLKIIQQESAAKVHSNAVGIPLVAIAQGIIALIGFFIFGIEDPFFWFVIVTIGSMIPFVGTLVGILPVFILTLSMGNTGAAFGILLYGLIVVGSTDNIIRLYVLKKLDDVHPLITLVGVIIGVPLFGFIGLIFGPLLISLFLLVLKIYKKEYSTNYQ